MLGNRILTAAVLVPLVVAAVLWLPSAAIAVLFGLVATLGAAELARLAGLAQAGQIWAYAAAVGAAMLASYPLLDSLYLPWLIAAAGAWWLANAVLLLLGRPDVQPRLARQPGLLLGGGLLLLACWAALVSLHQGGSQGPARLLFLLVLIWVADSAAYFAGRQWGRTKLAPAISPGKTRAGLYGALVGALLCALVLQRLELVPGAAWPGLLALCLVSTLISVAGDLWESLLKRRRGVKDSGSLLPGHGGVLDRIDSLIAAGPVFTLGVALLEGLA
ncbi:MAG: hypothetical protein RLZ44_693 [Pseudomonadota bacterium]|jgi:phosphatidate cytidylyltransferase